MTVIAYRIIIRVVSALAAKRYQDFRLNFLYKKSKNSTLEQTKTV